MIKITKKKLLELRKSGTIKGLKHGLYSKPLREVINALETGGTDKETLLKHSFELSSLELFKQDTCYTFKIGNQVFYGVDSVNIYGGQETYNTIIYFEA